MVQMYSIIIIIIIIIDIDIIIIDIVTVYPLCFGERMPLD